MPEGTTDERWGDYVSGKITDVLMHRAGMNRLPISGIFELTPMCNFSCKMCYVRKNKAQVAEEGGLRKKEEWLGWAEEAKKQGMLYLLITGGEPFFYPEFWELYSELTKMGFIISINSNGSLIDEMTAKKLAAMPPRKINITLYGASDESYEKLCGIKNGFTRVMNAAACLKENGINYKYNCSLTPYNCHEMKKMYEIAHDQNVPIEIATYMFPPVRRTREILEEGFRLTPEKAGYYSMEAMLLQLDEDTFYRYARHVMKFEMPDPEKETAPTERGREMACRAGRCSFWLNWRGELSACGMISNPCYSLGEYSFENAWKRIVEDTNRIRCLSGCAGCKNRKICHACISTAYCETGDINGRPDYMCRMMNAEAEACRGKLKESELRKK